MFGALALVCWWQAGMAADDALARIRGRMVENLTGLPNYTCEQTVDRLARFGGSPFALVDRLRLEVSYVGGKELYAWPGAEKFDRDILEMGVGGAVGSGSFALHAGAIFRGKSATFAFDGEVTEGGRKCLRFRYRVSRERSTYELRVGDNSAVVPYEGWFLADAETLELIRLEVEAYDIPPGLGLTRARTVTEYGRRRIGHSDYLLPVASEMLLVRSTSETKWNQTRFAACRQYVGESVIHFDETPVATAEAVKGGGTLPLPSGVSVKLKLTTALDGQRAAIGDPVRAAAAHAVKQAGAEVIPKGAIFTGRLTRMERHRANSREVHIVGIRLDHVEFDGNRRAVTAWLEEVTGGARRYLVSSASRRRGLEANWRSVIFMRPGNDESILLVRGPLRLPAGLRMVWRLK